MKTKSSEDINKKSLNGIIFLFGGIECETAESICKDIIKLNMDKEVPWIQIIINTAGGYCSDGFAIIDIMEWSQIPIFTTGIGVVGSMGLLIFMSGEKGKRVITPRTSILSHRYSGISFGNHSQLVATRREQDLMHQRILNHYIQHTNLKTEEKICSNLLRDVDTWLTPEQTIEFGIADIIQNDMKIKYPDNTVKISDK